MHTYHDTTVTELYDDTFGTVYVAERTVRPRDDMARSYVDVCFQHLTRAGDPEAVEARFIDFDGELVLADVRYGGEFGTEATFGNPRYGPEVTRTDLQSPHVSQTSIYDVWDEVADSDSYTLPASLCPLAADATDTTIATDTIDRPGHR